MSLYVDGELVAEGSRTCGLLETWTQMPIQASASAITAVTLTHRTTSRFDGLIDELSVYNRALTGEEVQGIYNAGATAGKIKMAVAKTDPDLGSVVTIAANEFRCRFHVPLLPADSLDAGRS